MRRRTFFREMARQGLGLTYDDVQLETGYSNVLPDDVDVESRFSRRIKLRVPLVSAAMDRVTEARMAIGMAMCGGLGVIHRNMPEAEQAKQVGRVRYHTNGRIDRPICVSPADTVGGILEMIERKNYQFHSFPVVDRRGKLLGLMTKSKFDFCDDPSLTAREVMATRLITAPVDIELGGAYELMKRKQIRILPIVDKRGKLQGLYVYSDLRRIKNGTSYNLDAQGKLIVGAAVGVGADALSRAKLLAEEGAAVLVIDTAHADTASVIETLKLLKKEFPDIDIVVGNISHPASARRLLDVGADGIKVGQGSGSICSTRVVAGIGCPQLTAVYRICRVAERYGVPVCADGGISYSGDVFKALAAGASSVMCGSVFAGTDEAPGETIFYNDGRWKSYRGMGSLGAMEEHAEARSRYQQTEGGKDTFVPEGIEGMVRYKGSLAEVITQYIGGLRRGMGYVGARTLGELTKRARFVRVTHAGVAEAHPHNVLITKEAPNYSGR